MADQNKTDHQLADEIQTLDVGEDFNPYAGDVEFVVEKLDGSLVAPPESQWYHGRLDRQTAEERLRSGGVKGTYLIRESERKQGHYVLSFLGETGINHFRITAMCGDYYIGGRQFDSLSDLIGYYTEWSDLLKRERLNKPIIPPEPVDDKRRVVAILPYNKIPDTDELSFNKGDVFIVHNELGDGWIWVTSQRTQESGIVYQELVEDLNGGVTPVEANEWFHPDIKKDEAAKRLVQAGQGSFLVRPSETSFGDYSLYYHINNSIQKFKITKTDRRFVLGGRTFDSINAIIERYKKEQIVEGYKLGEPVLREKSVHVNSGGDSPDSRGRDIYATIRQSSGSNFLVNRNDHIVMKGYLYKKSEKPNRWKNMYFVLNGTEQHLYFFENEKRSKPKGLIDLSYSSLYPVHDSLFGRQGCFQLVVRALNHFSVHYLCADTTELAQEWVQSLKPYCTNTCPRKNQPNSLKEIYSLSVHILDAHRIPAKHAPHCYCTVALNDSRVKVCRTEAREAPDPVWGEEFFLDDIPTDIFNFIITIHNKSKRSKDTEVLQISVPLNELTQGDLTDEWYPLMPTNAAIKPGDLGSLRVKSKFLHEIIMPCSEYSSLKELLLAKELQEIIALAQVCGNDRISLAKSLLNIFVNENQEIKLLRVMNDKEIEKEETVSNLFRATSFATTLMDQYMKKTAGDFVEHAMKKTIEKILESKQSCELNPAMLDNPTDAAMNREHLLSLLDDVVENIFMSRDKCPLVLRHICGALQKKVKEKWPHDDSVRTRVVSGFIFLRLFCPTMLNPKCFNLISETPSDLAARTLKLVAKALQNLANLVEFGVKEMFMEGINPFIVANKQRMIMFLDELSNVPELPTTSHTSCDTVRDLANVHQICTSHAQELSELTDKQPLLKKLVAVTDIITKHKQHYLGNL